MAADPLQRAKARLSRRQLNHLSRQRLFFEARLVRVFGLVCLLLSLFVATRQFRLLKSDHHPDSPPHTAIRPGANDDDIDDDGAPILNGEASVNLWRRVERNLPPERNPPDPNLYGTGTEKCFSLGLPDAVKNPIKRGDPAAFWQMNSRALCYSSRPMCLYGRSLEKLLTFEPRGSGTCQVVAVEKEEVLPLQKAGMNESCAAFRERQVARMYGAEVFYEEDKWQDWVNNKRHLDPRHHAVKWESDFAIIVPKYDWSYNICHYNRIWNFVIYTIRHLHLFVPDADAIKTIDIRFRSGYAYNELWHQGLRNATLPALMRETGKNITLGKIRFDFLRDFQCVRRGIVLGREGRIDAFPFYNDTPVWRPEHQINDTHWPSIPHDSLWLREVVMQANGLPSVGKYSGPGVGVFKSIPVPPRRVGVLQRSPRSKRRLTRHGMLWFEETLQKLCRKYNMELEHVRTSGAMTLGEQVRQVHKLGIAVGLHGANIVNTMFVPAGGALFEIFPWRYVRYYYAGGGNTGLRYSFHEPEGGVDRHCSFESKTCFMYYRESVIYLTEKDQEKIHGRLESAFAYVAELHRRFPSGYIPLKRVGNVYVIEK